MTNTDEKWMECPKPETGNVVRWKEPIWAAPNKPRGKPDKIGEQRIVAEIVSIEEFIELTVRDVERLSLDDGATERTLKVKAGDQIRRKASSLTLGNCEKVED